MIRIAMGLIFATLLTISVWFGAAARAQTSAEPQLFITWHAGGSYAPPGYEGKILPTTGSSIAASLSIVENGKLADLSGETIYWYVGGNFVGGGVGATSVSFTAPGVAPNTIDLRAQLPDYKGALTLQTIKIPMVRPELALEAPFARGRFGGPITIKARPFFFGVSNMSKLVFGWSVGSEDVSSQEKPDVLELTPALGTTSGSLFQIRATVKNPIRFSEIAARELALTFGGQ